MATILIVDDLPANRTVLATILSHAGHRLLEAADGAAALALVRSERPDLVITDVLMPVMDGYEFVRTLRADAEIRDTRIIFHTAHYGEREARALALSSGVAAVLRKPSEAAAVIALVERVLDGHTDEAAADPAALPPAFDRAHLRLVTDKLSERAADLRRANARLRALINIGLELASERDLARLLERVCIAARDLFAATSVTVGILDSEGQTLQRIVTCGAEVTEVRAGDAVTGILATVVAERRSMRGHGRDGGGLPRFHDVIEHYVAAPVASANHAYGWICMVGNDGLDFTEDDEQLVMALAGQVGRIYEVEHEIVERHRAEEDLRQALEQLRLAEERMRFALEAAGVGVWDSDMRTGVVSFSPILEAQYGLPSGGFAGTLEAVFDRIHPDDRDRMRELAEQAARDGSDFAVSYRTLWPDGTVRWMTGAGRIFLAADGTPLRAVGIAQDVTERHALEQQYQQAQKMEAIGRLAGGIAHDFNNLLTIILGNCDLALPGVAAGSQLHTDILEIRKAGGSAAALTRQLLAFSRKQIIEPTRVDLNAVVEDMRAMFERLIGEDITVTLALAPGLAPVKADRGQMEQVVMNLAVNARDAMPHGGLLTIETANVELDSTYTHRHHAVAPGAYTMISVSDTGTGMTPEVQARLFEPFFTTKPPGHGTGLGLATVHGIVALGGGTVDVYSESGKGTSIKVYLPQCEPEELVVPTPPPPVATERHGGETVLIVDDVAGLRELARRVLQPLGYTVLVAADPDAAVQLFDQHPAIDLLITDIVMPGASGTELAGWLVARGTALKILYMSGYAEQAMLQRGMLESGAAFIHKPFTADGFARKVRDTLDAAPVAAPGPRP